MAGDDIRVELALVGPPPSRRKLRVARGVTAAELMRAQGLAWPDPGLVVSIWGHSLDGHRRPDPQDCLLEDGDRLEICPRIRRHPMDQRRARARAQGLETPGKPPRRV